MGPITGRMAVKMYSSLLLEENAIANYRYPGGLTGVQRCERSIAVRNIFAVAEALEVDPSVLLQPPIEWDDIDDV